MSIRIDSVQLDFKTEGFGYLTNKIPSYSATDGSLSNLAFTRPLFDDLPLQPHHPKGSAWGVWGVDDERGTLNLLTDDVVRDAAIEVLEGKVVNLK